MVRAPSIDKHGIKRGEWSDEEDNKLKAYVLENGHSNWRQLPRLAGLARCGKSCRLRWKNYLMPGLKRGPYTKEEVELIIKLRQEHGNKWSLIASHLPGRTDNEIKNYWHTHMKKCNKPDRPSRKPTSKRSKGFDQMQVMESMQQDSKSMPLIQEAQVIENDTDFIRSLTQVASMASFQGSLGEIWGEPLMLDASNDLFLQCKSHDSVLTDGSFGGLESFWTEPFLLDTSNSLISPSTSCNSTLTDASFDSLESFWTKPFMLNTSNNLISPSTSCSSALNDGSFGRLESYCTEPLLFGTSNSLVSPSTSCSFATLGSSGSEPLPIDASSNHEIFSSATSSEEWTAPFMPLPTGDTDLLNLFSLVYSLNNEEAQNGNACLF